MTIDELAGLVGQELGVSRWRSVSQADLDAFAAVTGDDQFIHVDPERARRETPFGGTIAHGFLTLSLLPIFGRDVIPTIEGRRMGVNYGIETMRFLAPVPTGARVRGRFVLRALERRKPGEILLRYAVMVEIEGGTRPALVAEWVTLAMVDGA